MVRTRFAAATLIQIDSVTSAVAKSQNIRYFWRNLIIGCYDNAGTKDFWRETDSNCLGWGAGKMWFFDLTMQEFCVTFLLEVFIVQLLKRKIDDYLISWKANNDRMPLIVKGARQIGKTTSIRELGKTYEVGGLKKNKPFETEAQKIEKTWMILYEELEPMHDGLGMVKNLSVPSGKVVGLRFDRGKWRKVENLIPRNSKKKNEINVNFYDFNKEKRLY